MRLSRMIIQKKLRFFMVFCCIFLTTNILELFSLDCPIAYDDCNWKKDHAVFEPFPMELWGYVDFKYQTNGGRIEIVVDWSKLTNCRSEILTNADMIVLLKKAIMSWLVDEHSPGMQYEFVFYEVTKCYSVQRAYIKIKTNKEVYCIDLAVGAQNPALFNYNGETFWKLQDKVECGEKCCENIYTVETENRNGTTNAKILGLIKSPLPGSQCNCDPVYDCLTGQEIPINSECN